VAGKTWVVESPRDIEAPLIWAYYTIDGTDVIVRDYQVVRDWAP
jgi:hypothetical protein